MKKVLLTATVQSHIAQFHRPLTKVLHELGYEVHVAAYDNLAEKNGLKLDFVDKVYDVPFARSPIDKSNFEAYVQIKEIIRKESYEVIHCNTPMGGIVTRLAAISTRKKGTKVIYTAHGFHFYKGAPLKNWLLYYPIEKLFSMVTDLIITINSEDYQLAKKKFKTQVKYIHGVGVDEKRYEPIRDDDKYELRKKMGYGRYENIILCIGELNMNKNHIMAINMMKEVVNICPNSILLIAGNGPEKDILEGKIVEYNLHENIKLIGYCTNLEEYQKIADVVVTCSYREGLPLNVVEALLSGNPVVASVNRGHKELIESGKNGFLVENRDDYLEMAKYVIGLLKSRNERDEFAKYARSSMLQYGKKSVEDELMKIYKEL